jgi:two-component system, NtrC family, sensor histidine kinase HydH
MEDTIQGLLDFARPPQLHRVHHDLRDTVRRALKLVEGRAHQQHVQLAEEFPAAAVMVDADPEQLHQVFVNLALNAIEAMTAGGRLGVTVSADGNGAGRCEVVFQDSGPGIPAEIMERVFEPFVTTKKQGTGLGLAISRRLIEEHAGTLRAVNRSGGGAELIVELPMPLAPQGSQPSEAERETDHVEASGH